MTTFTITIEALSFSDLMRKLRDMVNEHAENQISVSEPASNEEIAEDKPSPKSVSTEAKKGRGRPKKDSSEPIAEEAHSTFEPAAEAFKEVKKEVTKEEVTAMLTRVNSEKGLPTARTILKKFTANERLSSVPVERYSEFLAACEAAL